MSDNLPEITQDDEGLSEAFKKARTRRSEILGILVGLVGLIGVKFYLDKSYENNVNQGQNIPRLHFDFNGEINKALKAAADEEAKKKDKKVKEEKPGTDSKIKKSKKKPAQEEGNPKDDDLPPQTALA
jgi:hypothetical protein